MAVTDGKLTCHLLCMEKRYFCLLILKVLVTTWVLGDNWEDLQTDCLCVCHDCFLFGDTWLIDFHHFISSLVQFEGIFKLWNNFTTKTYCKWVHLAKLYNSDRRLALAISDWLCVDLPHNDQMEMCNMWSPAQARRLKSMQHITCWSLFLAFSATWHICYIQTSTGENSAYQPQCTSIPVPIWTVRYKRVHIQ